MQIKKSFTITEIQIGMTASYSQTITDADIKGFSRLSGDHNPVHVNEEYAKNSRYKGRIAHGLLTASFFSAIFGTKLPGEGCVYVSQNLQFKRPVYLGDYSGGKSNSYSCEYLYETSNFRNSMLSKWKGCNDRYSRNIYSLGVF